MRRRVILPGSRPQTEGPLQIFVPSGYDDPADAAAESGERLLICRVATGPETICGATFPAHDLLGWQRHCGECAQRHIDAIRERSPRNRLPEIFEEADPEWAAHQRKVGERMLREGRLVPKPNER